MATNKTFDPTAYGAKPVVAKPTVGFDPAAFGAKPIVATPAPVVEKKPNTVQSIVSDLSSRAKKVKTDFQNVDKPGMPTAPEVALRTVGNIAGGANDVIGGVFGGILKTAIKVNKAIIPDKIENKIVENVKNNRYVKLATDVVTSKPVQKAVDVAKNTYEKVPNRVKESVIDPVAQIAQFIPLGKGAKVATTAAKDVAEIGAKEFAEQSGKRAIKKSAAKTAEVIQAGTKEIPIAEKAFGAIDTKGVKTYEQLKQRLTDKVKTLAEEVDINLSKDTGVYKTADLATDGINHVDNALKDLQELYTKGRDTVGLSRVNALIAKGEKQGFTRKELNDIARDYNTELGTKGFDKLGNAKNSVTADAFENTRKGVKKVARGGIGGAEAEAVDRTISSIKATEVYVDKMVEAVQKLQQKIQKRNILQKMVYGGTNLVNTILGGTPKTIVASLLPRGLGLKTMNALDLEKALSKNLKLIQKAVKAKDNGKVMQIVKKIEQQLALPAPKADAPKASNFIPIQMGADSAVVEKLAPGIKTPGTTTRYVNSKVKANQRVQNALNAAEEAKNAGKPLPEIQMGAKPTPKGKKKVKGVPSVSSETSPKVIEPVLSRYTSKTSIEKKPKAVFSKVVFRGGKGTSPNGTFYSPDKEVAESYAKRKGGGITKEKVNLNNPLVIDAEHNRAITTIVNVLKKKDPTLAKKFEKIVPFVRGNKYSLMKNKKQAGELFERDIIENVDPVFKEYAQKYGFDGIVRMNGKKVFEVVDLSKTKRYTK